MNGKIFQKKIKVIYNVNSIVDANKKDCNRSGVYFVALNILKELIKYSEIKLSLYCDTCNWIYLDDLIKNELKNKKYDKIINYPNGLFYEINKNLKEEKQKYKENKNILMKFICQMLSIPISLIIKIAKFVLKLKILIGGYDVYFSPHSRSPKIFNRFKSIKKYNIIYDLIFNIFPEYYKKWNHGHWSVDLINSVNGDDYYFPISENTKRDLLKYCPQVDPNKVFTNLISIEDKFKPAKGQEIENVKKKYDIKDRYVFSLCTLEPRKNLVRVVKTFIEFINKNKINDMVFVLAGGHWNEFISELEKEIKDLGNYKDRILKIGYVDDEDLTPLYSGAEWFVYTSQYEGFGLPPLEAMACGCPVITSNNSSLPEVVGDAGIMINWDSDEEHIKAYEKYYFNDKIREEYRQKGIERAKNFSWKKYSDTIVKTMKTYKRRKI